MRHPVLLTGLLLLMPAAAHAQVTIDLRALEALPQAPPPTSRPPRQVLRPVLRMVPAGPAATAVLPVPPVAPGTAPGQAGTGRATASAMPTLATPTLATPAAPVPPTAPTSPTPPTATLPTAPPAVATLAPIPPAAAPTTTTPPTPSPVSATSGTTVAPDNGGLSLIFKADESDLSPAANGAIGELVKSTQAGETITFNVVAYAKGVTDDPSAARRTSLARGLSVRAALIADGVPSTRVYVRALGSSSSDGPPDRVDLTVLGTSGVAASPGGTTAGGTTPGGTTPGGTTAGGTTAGARAKP
jgi:outer membrane protein OmpA-like peptidoglycan-associated protein